MEKEQILAPAFKYLWKANFKSTFHRANFVWTSVHAGTVIYMAEKSFPDAKTRFWYAVLDPSRVTLTMTFSKYFYPFNSDTAVKERDIDSFIFNMRVIVWKWYILEQRMRDLCQVRVLRVYSLWDKYRKIFHLCVV